MLGILLGFFLAGGFAGAMSVAVLVASRGHNEASEDVKKHE